MGAKDEKIKDSPAFRNSELYASLFGIKESLLIPNFGFRPAFWLSGFPDLKEVNTMPAIPRLIVELYSDPYYRGRKVTLIDSAPDTLEIGANETTSSIKIYRGPGFDTAPNYKAIFCEHPNYQGRKLILAPGYYPNIHEIPYNFGDIISSVRLSPASRSTPPEYGAIPVIIEIYQDTDFQGQKGIILRDVSSIADIGMNDNISSLRIYRGPHFPFSGCQVVFYENPNFEGNRLTVTLNNRGYRKEISNLHNEPERFGGIISSAKIAPTGNFNVLIVVGDSETTEPAVLESLPMVEGNEFNYTTVKVNHNAENRGDPYNAMSLSSVDLSEFDIIWFTWNAPGHDKEYFLEDAEDAIKDFVRQGGIVWASAMDDNNNSDGGEWRGGWLPLKQHPITVKNSSDVNVDITDRGGKTGMFTWPHKIDVNSLTTDDHWITKDRFYTVLARRHDNNDPVSIQLRWGDGYYVTFAIDTRDAVKSQMSKTFMENIICYLASLAWQTSPRQPLKTKQYRVAATSYSSGR